MISLLVVLAQLITCTLLGLLLYKVYLLAKGGEFASDDAPLGELYSFRNVLKVEKSRTDNPLFGAKRNEFETTAPGKRIDSFAKAQIFAGLQMLELKQRGVDINNSPKKTWLINAVGFYFFGAATIISKRYDCQKIDLEDILTFLLTRNLDFSYEESQTFIGKAINADHDEAFQDDLYDLGKHAAEAWLAKKSVPGDLSLYHAIDEWGLVA
ncbi:MAG: hypothetical protein MI864_23705 [Pseudomonadales bacterium]|nr:hypothetical protein [Pseudomonadales bacterium]